MLTLINRAHAGQPSNSEQHTPALRFRDNKGLSWLMTRKWDTLQDQRAFYYCMLGGSASFAALETPARHRLSRASMLTALDSSATHLATISSVSTPSFHTSLEPAGALLCSPESLVYLYPYAS